MLSSKKNSRAQSLFFRKTASISEFKEIYHQIAVNCSIEKSGKSFLCYQGHRRYGRFGMLTFKNSNQIVCWSGPFCVTISGCNLLSLKQITFNTIKDAKKLEERLTVLCFESKHGCGKKLIVCQRLKRSRCRQRADSSVFDIRIQIGSNFFQPFRVTCN